MGPGTVPARGRLPTDRPVLGRVPHGILVAVATTEPHPSGGETVAQDGAPITIVGDGPAGLSAALFLAKNDHDVAVYGDDETAMHYAYLHNYLGVPDVDGSEFQRTARDQVTEHGAKLVDARVESIQRRGDRFVVTTEDGDERDSEHVIVAGAQASRELLEELGAEIADGAPVLDEHYRTSVDGVYAAGRVARPNRSQAVISAGAGAVAALDILSRIEGHDVTDWDTPDDA